MTRKFKTIVLSYFVFCMHAYAGGGGLGNIVFDPSNYAENIITATQSIQQTTDDFETAQAEIQNIKNVANFKWDDASQTLQNLANTIQQANGLAYSMSNLSTQFSKTYPGYQADQNYSSSYQNWSTTTMNTISGVLQSVGLQSQDFATEGATLDTLRNMSSSSAGQMQALQAGNMIAGEMSNQMQELRQLSMSQINSESAYEAYQVQKDQTQQSGSDNFINNMNSAQPTYDNSSGFSYMPNFNQ